MDPCVSNPCVEGSTCIADDTTGFYTCLCIDTRVGLQCEFRKILLLIIILRLFDLIDELTSYILVQHHYCSSPSHIDYQNLYHVLQWLLVNEWGRGSQRYIRYIPEWVIVSYFSNLSHTTVLASRRVWHFWMDKLWPAFTIMFFSYCHIGPHYNLPCLLKCSVSS